MFMLYLFNQIIPLFHFSSIMLVQKSFKFSTAAISSSYDILYAELFKINNILPLWVIFYMLR